MGRKVIHIDSFAGSGDINIGLYATVFQSFVAIENVKSCCDTY